MRTMFLGSDGPCRRTPARWRAAAALMLAVVALPVVAEEDDPLWIEPDAMVDWRTVLTLGITYAKSQSETHNVALAAEANRITGDSRWRSSLQMISGRSDGETNAALFDLRTRYDRDFRKRWFGFIQGEHRRDEPANLERRDSVAVGAGYRLRERRHVSWSVLGGVGYTAESFFTPLDIIGGPRTRYHRAEALIGTEAEFEVGRSLTVSQRFVYFPNLSFDSAYRLTYDATVAAAITQRMSMNITASWRHSTEPGVDKRPDELVIVTGLSLRLD